jgi:hypothetical protein
MVVLVPEPAFKALTEAAKAEGMSVSEAFAKAISAWAESHRKPGGTR